MNKKRFSGLVIILVGILTSLSQMAITGAVIGIGKSYLTNILGALITFVGIIVFSLGQKEVARNKD
jgi:ATP/ADP translocase